LTLSSNSSSFNDTAFRVSFAVLNNVDPNDVETTLPGAAERRRRLQTSGFDVNVRVGMSDLAAATTAMHTLSNRSAATLSADLGVTVVSITPPSVVLIVVVAPSPPPPSPTPPSPPPSFSPPPPSSLTATSLSDGSTAQRQHAGGGGSDDGTRNDVTIASIVVGVVVCCGVSVYALRRKLQALIGARSKADELTPGALVGRVSVRKTRSWSGSDVRTEGNTAEIRWSRDYCDGDFE